MSENTHALAPCDVAGKQGDGREHAGEQGDDSALRVRLHRQRPYMCDDRTHRAELDDDRRLGDLGSRAAHERDRRALDRAAVGGIIHDDEHGGAAGHRSVAQRIDRGPVQRDLGANGPGELRELRREARAVIAIERALALDRSVDRRRARGEGEQHERSTHGSTLPRQGDRSGRSSAIAFAITVEHVNAVEHFVQLLAPEALRRLAALRVVRFEASDVVGERGLDLDTAHARVIARWHGDLCGFLNALTRGELVSIAARLAIEVDGRAPALRERLWRHGAALESGGLELPSALQPRPVLLGGHLVVQAPPRGVYAASETLPRPVPAPRDAEPPHEEPDSIDELLAAADRAIGVRLGRRGRDKGAWGMRAARLLGVVERGIDEPDWRGDVEIKTVPIAREPSGLWRIVEDPAISMLGEARPLAKLQRTLWLARAGVDDGDATIVSWYLLEWDATIARLARRYLHVRPKGPAGTDQRGIYVHKRFFADAGLLATLNGLP